MIADEEFDKHLKAGDLAALRLAVESDHDLLKRGWRRGTTPWITRAMDFDTYQKTVPVLLHLGADIDAASYTGQDALNSALAEANLEKVRFLLEHGAKPMSPRTAWHGVTATRDQLELVKLLDRYGADIHEVREGGFSGRYANPLSLAKDYGLDDVVTYLESRGCVMPPADDWEPGEAVDQNLTQSQLIIDHFTQTVGKPERLALIEIVPTGIPIAIHAIPNNERHPFVTLFTTGMSDKPMNVPEEAKEYSGAELYIQLPANWKYRDYEDPNWGWPQHWLRKMVQYPNANNTWLGGPVALVANGEPPAPIAPKTKLTTMMLFADQSLLSASGEKIWLYRMMPLYTEERQLEIDHGLDALLNAFDKHDISMIVDMKRNNVAYKSKDD